MLSRLRPGSARAWHIRLGAVGLYLRDYVADIGAFLREISGPAVLMGHSLGGMIAVAAAKACPDLVRAVIVGDAPLDAVTLGQVMRDQRGRIAAWRALSGGTHPVEEIESIIDPKYWTAC